MPLKFPERITYWLEGINNGTGGKTYSVGMIANARIARVSEMIFNKEGKEIHASTAVYAATAMPEGTYVVEGEREGDALPNAGARQVIWLSQSSMRNVNKMLLR